MKLSKFNFLIIFFFIGSLDKVQSALLQYQWTNTPKKEALTKKIWLSEKLKNPYGLSQHNISPKVPEAKLILDAPINLNTNTIHVQGNHLIYPESGEDSGLELEEVDKNDFDLDEKSKVNGTNNFIPIIRLRDLDKVLEKKPESERAATSLSDDFTFDTIYDADEYKNAQVFPSAENDFTYDQAFYGRSNGEIEEFTENPMKELAKTEGVQVINAEDLKSNQHDKGEAGNDDEFILEDSTNNHVKMKDNTDINNVLNINIAKAEESFKEGNLNKTNVHEVIKQNEASKPHPEICVNLRKKNVIKNQNFSLNLKELNDLKNLPSKMNMKSKNIKVETISGDDDTGIFINPLRSTKPDLTAKKDTYVQLNAVELRDRFLKKLMSTEVMEVTSQSSKISNQVKLREKYSPTSILKMCVEIAPLISIDFTHLKDKLQVEFMQDLNSTVEPKKFKIGSNRNPSTVDSENAIKGHVGPIWNDLSWTDLCRKEKGGFAQGLLGGLRTIAPITMENMPTLAPKKKIEAEILEGWLVKGLLHLYPTLKGGPPKLTKDDAISLILLVLLCDNNPVRHTCIINDLNRYNDATVNEKYPLSNFNILNDSNSVADPEIKSDLFKELVQLANDKHLPYTYEAIRSMYPENNDKI